MIKDFDEGEGVPEDFRSQTEDGIQDWLAGRKGKQIHIYDVTQWRDIIHRCYFSCLRQRGEGPVSSISCATVSKSKVTKSNTTLDLSGSPSDTIELAILHAIPVAKESGITSSAFGGAASLELRAPQYMSGTRAWMLQRTYKTFGRRFKSSKGMISDRGWVGRGDPSTCATYLVAWASLAAALL